MQKTMKRVLSVLLCAALLFGAAPLNGFAGLHFPELNLPSLSSLFAVKAQAADPTSGTCGTNLTWNYNTSTKTLTISGTGAMYGYDHYSPTPPWEAYDPIIKTVVVNSGVTSIGWHAFDGCKSLTSVTIPNSVKRIGDGAFYGCTGLTSVTIPDSVTGIGGGAFSGCTGLTSVTIPDSVTHIGDGAFSGCTGLTSVTIPESVKSIGMNAFSGCTGLTSVTIPGSVTSIGGYAFYGCTGLTRVTISDSVTSIGNFAFYECTGLTSVIIGNSVMGIGDYAFYGCTGLTSVIIGNSVMGIGYSAFSGCTGLTSVTIPNSVTSISDYAFYGCTGLTNVTIPNSVTNIGLGAFQCCTGLTSVTIPDSVTSISWYAFDGCTGLTSVTIGNGVTEIDLDVFSGCTGLTSVIIGNSVTRIADSAFSGCTGLTSVTIPDSVTSIDNNAFYGCTGLTSVTIGNSVTIIGNYAFYGCTGLTSVTIPNSVTSIGSYAFYGCTGLTNVTIPDSVTSIAIYTFDNTGYYNNSSNWQSNALYIGNHFITAKTALAGSYTIKPGTITIAGNAFRGCRGLTSVTIPDSVTSIGGSAFYGCTGLTSVMIPDSVTSIYSFAFYECTGLTSVAIPASVTSIDDCVFSGCTGLTRVTIPASVTSVGWAAFSNCTGLTDVYYGGTEAQWKEISIDSYNDRLQNATIHYNWDGYEDDDVHESIPFGSGKSVFVELCQSWFGSGQSNKIYHHGLARFCAAFAMLGYSTNAQITSYLTQCGFRVLFRNMDAGRDEVNTFVAVKRITVAGAKKNLIFVGTIGSNDQQWYSDFDPYGKGRTKNYAGNAERGITHLGFADARDYAYEMVQTALEQEGLDQNIQNNILLFTGHSRGAAAANLLAAKAIDEAKWAMQENIYAYAFATPRSTTKANVHEIRYNCIFNIVNPEDFVTKVMLHGWKHDGCGYDRYGKTLVLPSKTNTKGAVYKEQLARMKNYFSSFTNHGVYNPFLLGETATYEIALWMLAHVPTVDAFYDWKYPYKSVTDWASPYDFFRTSLLVLLTDDSMADKLTAAGNLLATMGNGAAIVCYQSLIQYFFSVSLKTAVTLTQNQVVDLMDVSDFKSAHCAETYCAWMYVRTEQEMLDYEGKTGYLGSVNCPVDVEIIDKETGEVVGRITDNTVDEEILAQDNSVVVAVNGDEKTFWLPSDGDYEVKLIGSDVGKMDYTLAEIDSDAGELGRMNYFDVPLTDGLTYTGAFPESAALSEHALTRENGTVVEPDEAFDAEHAAAYTVTVNAGENGMASGGGRFTSGNYATVYAFPNENCEFNGWYAGETLVSSDETYRFRVDSDVTLTAKFHVHEHTPGAWEPAGGKLVQKCTACGAVLAEKDLPRVKAVSLGDVTMNYKASTTLEPQITADEGAKCTPSYSSSNPDVAKVDDNGKVTAAKKGTATITCTVTDQYGNVVKDTCKVTVKYSAWQWVIIILLFGWLWY